MQNAAVFIAMPRSPRHDVEKRSVRTEFRRIVSTKGGGARVVRAHSSTAVATVIVRHAAFLRICTSAVFLGLARPVPADAVSVLRSADIRIVMRSADACDVTMTLAVDGSSLIDHRIEAADESRIELSAVQGAIQPAAPQRVGRTLSLILEPHTREYELAYTVERLASQYRCPVWVPAVPADGRSRQVRISVELPSATSAGTTMPLLTWQGTSGSTMLGHIPAFVRAPFAAHGDTTIWDVSKTMDVLTLVVFAAASGIWVWRRRR